MTFIITGMQGSYKNDMIGLVFDPLVPGQPKMSGEEVITKIYGLSLDHSKWWDLCAVFAILICYRLTFFVILKVNEKAGPFFRSLYTKRTLYRLNQRPSFKRRPSLSYSSKRQYNLHPLSSQEGLNSPIPWKRLQKQLSAFDDTTFVWRNVFEFCCRSNLTISILFIEIWRVYTEIVFFF